MLSKLLWEEQLSPRTRNHPRCVALRPHFTTVDTQLVLLKSSATTAFPRKDGSLMPRPHNTYVRRVWVWVRDCGGGFTCISSHSTCLELRLLIMVPSTSTGIPHARKDLMMIPGGKLQCQSLTGSCAEPGLQHSYCSYYPK